MIEGDEPSASWNDRRHTLQPHVCFPFWTCEVILDNTQSPVQSHKIWNSYQCDDSALTYGDSMELGVRHHTFHLGLSGPQYPWRVGGAVEQLVACADVSLTSPPHVQVTRYSSPLRRNPGQPVLRPLPILHYQRLHRNRVGRHSRGAFAPHRTGDAAGLVIKLVTFGREGSHFPSASIITR